jgi:clan AA aspartic protease
MIQGIVNAKRQPIVPLTIRGDAGQEAAIETLLDTGYNGSLMLPLTRVEELGLRFLRTDTTTVADGRRVPVSVYAARVVWDGTERLTSVVAAGTQPLLGMSLTLGHRVVIEMVDGGIVSVEHL